MTQTNPFILTPMIPDEYFCDRGKETESLIRSITNQENVVITSPRRMGKTGLIYHCFNQPVIKDNYLTVSIDILHTTTLRELIMELGSAVFKHIAKRNERLLKLFTTGLRSLSGSFGYDPIQNTPTFDIRLGQITAPEYTLDEIFDYLERADKPCIVAIDEFQQITNYPEKNVEALLRGKIQRLVNTHFIYAGSERRIMNEMFYSNKRPFYQSATLMPLAPIKLDKYADFVTSHFKQAKKDIHFDTIKSVYEMFDGVTLYIHRVFHDAYIETMSDQTCSTADTIRIARNILLQNEKRMQEMLAFVTEQQKELLYAIAEEGTVSRITSSEFVRKHSLKSASAVQSAVRKLLEYEIITENGHQYSIADPLLRIWLKQRHDISA